MRNHLVDFLVHRSKLVQQAASSGSPVSNVTDITQRLKPKLVRPGKDHPLSNPSIQIN
jgi:hypothetical protein